MQKRLKIVQFIQYCPGLAVSKSDYSFIKWKLFRRLVSFEFKNACYNTNGYNILLLP